MNFKKEFIYWTVLAVIFTITTFVKNSDGAAVCSVVCILGASIFRGFAYIADLIKELNLKSKLYKIQGIRIDTVFMRFSSDKEAINYCRANYGEKAFCLYDPIGRPISYSYID